MNKRAIVIVLDSVGVGAAPDAALYGDDGANTLANVARAMNGLHIPHLASLGAGRICPLEGVPTDAVRGGYGLMVPQSAGKDTTNGHMEFVGVTLRESLPTYPHGFPREVMEPFERAIGRKTIGNRSASGTEIIEELGEKHRETGWPIVYTSADSVFQIAAHEDVIAVSDLYAMCEKARAILTGANAVGRVIARPFTGTPGRFIRTAHRRDYSRDFGPTLLTALTERGIHVTGIGKIEDIYSERGISQGIHTANNEQGVEETLRAMRRVSGPAVIFTNLVDFDMLYGHRNDPIGFGRAIEAFDRRLPEIIAAMRDGDLLLITADHGCDPTTPSTDHSRECVPILGYHGRLEGAVNLGERSTFADLGATIAHYFNVPWSQGTSFYTMLAPDT
ncbi:MAG: phosphopentomutase [Bacilli bacterium]